MSMRGPGSRPQMKDRSPAPPLKRSVSPQRWAGWVRPTLPEEGRSRGEAVRRLVRLDDDVCIQPICCGGAPLCAGSRDGCRFRCGPRPALRGRCAGPLAVRSDPSKCWLANLSRAAPESGAKAGLQLRALTTVGADANDSRGRRADAGRRALSRCTRGSAGDGLSRGAAWHSELSFAHSHSGRDGPLTQKGRQSAVPSSVALQGGPRTASRGKELAESATSAPQGRSGKEAADVLLLVRSQGGGANSARSSPPEASSSAAADVQPLMSVCAAPPEMSMELSEASALSGPSRPLWPVSPPNASSRNASSRNASSRSARRMTSTKPSRPSLPFAETAAPTRSAESLGQVIATSEASSPRISAAPT
mmetsp:Transcript_28357/g.75773  ORF Transcript_28357/g.75773 Transcript_28357/m.75773 type:complete len:363 (+) Transcript_28357:109-1197(+)